MQVRVGLHCRWDYTTGFGSLNVGNVSANIGGASTNAISRVPNTTSSTTPKQ
jgi:pseudomonalisin